MLHRIASHLTVLGLLAFVPGCATANKPSVVARQPIPVQWTMSANAESIYHYLEYQELLRDNRAEQALQALQRTIALDPSPRLYLDLANSNWRRHESESALKALKDGLERYPGNRELTVALVHYYMNQKMVDSAVTTYQDYLSRHSEDLEVRLELASIFIDTERFSESAEVLAIIPVTEQDPDVLYLRGKTYAGMGLRKKAIEVLEQALDIDPDDVDSLGELAFLYEMEKDYVAAEEIYSRLSDLGEDGEEVWLRQIELNLKLNNPDKALELSAKGPDEENYLLRVVGLFMEEKFFDHAATVLERVTTLPDTTSTVAFYQALLAYEGQEDKVQALKYLESIPRSDRLYDRALNFRGQILFQLGRVDQALDLARLGQRESPQDNSFWILESSILMDRKDYAGARSVLNKGLAQLPDDTGLLFQLGFAQHQLGETDAGMATMERIISIEPDNADALNFVGYTLADENRDLERALVLIQHANRLDPESAPIIDSLAWIHFRLGSLDKAWEQIQIAVSRVKNDPTMWEHYGDIALARGLINEARKGFEKALSLKPDHPKTIEAKLKALPRPAPHPLIQ